MTTKDFSSMGVPIKLLKKTSLVEASTNPERLPVYTLTFAIPSKKEWEEHLTTTTTTTTDTNTDREKKSDNNNSNSNISSTMTMTMMMMMMMMAKKKTTKRVVQERHHSEINLALGDIVKMVIPNYKPKSYSVSALRVEQNEFDVTVKVYPKGRASGYLDSLQIGDTIRSFGKSAGKYRNNCNCNCNCDCDCDYDCRRRRHNNNNNDNNEENNDDDDDDEQLSCSSSERVCIIVYGVGITEGLPVARAELELERMEKEEKEEKKKKKVTVLWASRTMEDTFWHDQIDELQQRYGKERFEVVHMLSREENNNTRCCYRGRINPSVVEDVFELVTKKNEQYPLFLSVGTKEMMRMTTEMLSSMGYAMPKYQLLPKKPKTN